MPEVTVYMPTKNRSALLLRAVSSVMTQTFEDRKLIVVNEHHRYTRPNLVVAGLMAASSFFLPHDSAARAQR